MAVWGCGVGCAPGRGRLAGGAPAPPAWLPARAGGLLTRAYPAGHSRVAGMLAGRHAAQMAGAAFKWEWLVGVGRGAGGVVGLLVGLQGRCHLPCFAGRVGWGGVLSVRVPAAGAPGGAPGRAPSRAPDPLAWGGQPAPGRGGAGCLHAPGCIFLRCKARPRAPTPCCLVFEAWSGVV